MKTSDFIGAPTRKKEFLKLLHADSDRVDLILGDEKGEITIPREHSSAGSLTVKSEEDQIGDDDREGAGHGTTGVYKKPGNEDRSKPSHLGTNHVTREYEGLIDESIETPMLYHDLASYLDQKKEFSAALKLQIETMIDRPRNRTRDSLSVEGLCKQEEVTQEESLRQYMEDRIIEENVILAALSQQGPSSSFLGDAHACPAAIGKGISRAEQEKYHEALSVPLARNRWRGPPSSPSHRKYLMSTNLKGRQRLSPWVSPENDPWSQQKKNNIGQEQLDKFLENAKKCAEVKQSKIQAWKREMEESLKKNSKPQVIWHLKP